MSLTISSCQMIVCWNYQCSCHLPYHPDTYFLLHLKMFLSLDILLFFAGFTSVLATWHMILSQNFMLDLLIFLPLDIFSCDIFFCCFYYLPRKFLLVIPMFLPLAILSCQIISLIHLIMFLPLAILSCHIIFQTF